MATGERSPTDLNGRGQVDLGLENKVALISGGSSGLGFAAASELAAEGAHVAICGRDPDRLAAATDRLRRVARGQVRAASVDITNHAAARAWVEEVAGDLGALHIAIISGGSPPTGAASVFEPRDYQAAVSLVLLPAVNLALAAVPHLKAAGWGRVLFVASETASMPIAPLALSGVTRGALTRFAQSLAPELARCGITVNVLAPGATRTELVERAAAKLVAADGDIEAQLASMGKHSAVGRLASPGEVGAVAAFLASERASFVTGTVQLIDGGASVMSAELDQYTAPSTYA
jgi:3-oxoacyl-[acyl-carrier protein] reductase